MKTLSMALKAHLLGEVTTLATCWKLTRRDSTILGFTDYDRDISFESVTYRAETGFTPSAVASSTGLKVDNLEVEGMLSDSAITEPDLLAGLYDFAEIEVFLVNYTDLTQGKLTLKRGWLGEVSLSSGSFLAEVRGLSQALSQNIGELFSPSCRATLGDTRCSIKLSSHTAIGTVTSSDSRYEFTDSILSGVAGIYQSGKVTFTSGTNSGLSMEIKEHYYEASSGGRVVLALPLPNIISVGDSYSIIKGCDKTLATCNSRFDNVLNFRGEPHVPGIDRMLETAGTRSNN